MRDIEPEEEYKVTSPNATALDIVSKAGPTTGIGIGVLALVWTLQQNVQSNTEALKDIATTSVAISTKLENIEDDIAEVKLQIATNASVQSSDLDELEKRVRDLEMSANQAN